MTLPRFTVSPPHAGPIAARRRPRILVITDYLPQDVATSVHGAFQRLHRHIASLQQIGDVDVIFLWPWHPDAWNEAARANMQELKRLWQLEGRIDLVHSRFTCQIGQIRILLPASLEPVFGRLTGSRNAATMQALLRIAGESNPDLVFAHRMGAILPAVRSLSGQYPVIADFDDVEHVRMQRQAEHLDSWAARVHLRIAAWLTKRLEREAVSMARASLVCSDRDAAYLRALAPLGRLALLPNAAQEREALPPSAVPTALFVGMVRYWPNAEGLVWLVRDVWPLVRRELPEARLILAGLGSDELGLADKMAGVEALGLVADLVPLYVAARLVLCPLRIASGTRIKIIEAAMFARPTVSTAIGAEGLAFVPGRDIAPADDEVSFARACVGLLGDAARSQAMGMAARDVARHLYSPAAVRARLVDICEAAMHAPGASNSIRPA